MADGAPDPNLEALERWERAATGWSARANEIRDFGMPVSAWLIDQLRLQPGQRVLELAAGPGDTGFMASELVSPAGTLISTDAVEPMLDRLLTHHWAWALGGPPTPTVDGNDCDKRLLTICCH